MELHLVENGKHSNLTNPNEDTKGLAKTSSNPGRKYTFIFWLQSPRPAATHKTTGDAGTVTHRNTARSKAGRWHAGRTEACLEKCTLRVFSSGTTRVKSGHLLTTRRVTVTSMLSTPHGRRGFCLEPGSLCLWKVPPLLLRREGASTKHSANQTPRSNTTEHRPARVDLLLLPPPGTRFPAWHHTASRSARGRRCGGASAGPARSSPGAGPRCCTRGPCPPSEY